MKIISWAGTVASILGSFIIAFQFMLAGYVCFLIGSVSWLYIGVVRKDRALIALNSAFLCANLIGLYNVF